MGMRKEQDIRNQQLSGDEARSPEDGVMIDLGPNFDPDSTSYACAVDSHGNVFGSALEDGLQQYLLYQAK